MHKFSQYLTLHNIALGLLTLYVVFISLFAFDSFSTGTPFYLQLTGFLIHLIPTFLGVITLVIAWKYSKIGGWIVITLGLISIYFFNTYQQPISFLIISLPLLLCGSLFLLSTKFEAN